MTRLDASELRITQLLRNHGNVFVALLCLCAGLRILFFTAAFPFFNSTDEQFHLAAIRMYASGQWPGKDLPPLDSETARLVALYGTPEYINSQAVLDRLHLAAPVYQLSPQEAEPYFAPAFRVWQRVPDFEAQAPPVYYLAAACWERFGEALGMRSWQSVYWIRLLNPLAYVVLIWVSYLFVRKVYPQRIFMWLGVPALLAVFPQDVFFGINRDVLSAPMTATALLWMVVAIERKEAGQWQLFLASIATGLTFLVNVSNCVLYAALAVTLWFWVRDSAAGSAKKAGVVAAAIATSAMLPCLWMFRNFDVMGDPTGSRAKIQFLGWTAKPLDQLLDHPLFSLDGLFYFLRHLTQSFWRGEYLWHREPMRWWPADWFYLISSAILIATFIIYSFRNWKSNSVVGRFSEIEALLLLFSSVLFMAGISLLFDFHNCFYPSSAHPFFVSGRIISGALLPFAILYVGGLEFLLARFRKPVLAAAIFACLLAFVTIAEFRVQRVALSSPNNFFALRAWRQRH